MWVTSLLLSHTYPLPHWCFLQPSALLFCKKSVLLLDFSIPHISTFLLFFSFKFGRKIFYVNYLSELEEYVKLEQLGIPSQVLKWEYCLPPPPLRVLWEGTFWAREGRDCSTQVLQGVLTSCLQYCFLSIVHPVCPWPQSPVLSLS